MKNAWILTLVALALAFTAVSPALAADAPAGELAPKAAVESDLSLSEEPNMTPAEQPEAPDLLGMEEEGRINRIRICEEEEQAQCPPGCGCAVFATGIRCFCP